MNDFGGIQNQLELQWMDDNDEGVVYDFLLWWC